MLILLPYQNMAVGQTVEVFWQLAGEPSSEKLDERVTGPEDVGQTMSFVLSRQRLEAMTDRLVQLYYKVRFGDRQIESSRQDILVVYDTPPSEPALEALPIKVVHPDTGNFVLTFELYEEPNWRTSGVVRHRRRTTQASVAASAPGASQRQHRHLLPRRIFPAGQSRQTHHAAISIRAPWPMPELAAPNAAGQHVRRACPTHVPISRRHTT
jgi:hypothetical protein